MGTSLGQPLDLGLIVASTLIAFCEQTPMAQQPNCRASLISTGHIANDQDLLTLKPLLFDQGLENLLLVDLRFSGLQRRRRAVNRGEIVQDSQHFKLASHIGFISAGKHPHVDSDLAKQLQETPNSPNHEMLRLASTGLNARNPLVTGTIKAAR
jgi:hypothetical protein